MYQWVCRTFIPGVQCDSTPVAFLSRADTEFRLVLITLQTWVQLLPEDVKSAEKWKWTQDRHRHCL